MCVSWIGGPIELEDKRIILLKHHPMNVKFTNPWYQGQADNLDKYLIVDVTSRVRRNKEFINEHPYFANDVSPFYMGPVTSSDGLIAHVFEHFWQASKVFPCHYDKTTNTIKPEYWAWRKSWFDKEKVTDKNASRRPHSLLGYQDKDCLFSVYYNGSTWERLSYVEARKRMYIPIYAKHIVETRSFQWLKTQYEAGKKIALVDFDGYNYYSKVAKEKLVRGYVNKRIKRGVEPAQSLEDFLSLNTMRDVIDCGFTPAGHGFIIKMLLEKDIEVIGNKVIDNIGVLGAKGEAIELLPQASYINEIRA